MSCIINRDNNNKVTSVQTPDGKKSQLFEAVRTDLYVGNNETAASIVANAYKSDIESTFKGAENNVYSNGEPKLFYSDENGNTFEDMEDLILDGKKGVVSMGFKHPTTNDFIPTATFDITGGRINSFLTSQVEQGFLEAKKVVTNEGNTRFLGKGNYTSTKRLMGRAVQHEAMLELGNGNVKAKPNGEIEIPLDSDYTLGYNTNGSIDVIRVVDIPNKVQEDSYTNAIPMIARYNLQYNNSRPLTVGQTKKSDPKEIERIEKSLRNFLNNMGFSLTTLEKYRENYNTKYGRDPDIQALADLSNKVVAIAEGRNITEEMLEEVAHIAIESYADQNSIVSAIANVHTTNEYKEHADFYRKKYSEFFEGVALEEQVRKEVLGKILAKEIKRGFNTQGQTEARTNIIQKVKNIWDKIVAYLTSKSSAYSRQTIDSINRKIAKSVINEDMTDFDPKFVTGGFFYDATQENPKDVIPELKQARDTLKSLYNQVLEQPVPNQAQLDNITSDMTTIDTLNAISAINNMAKSLLRQVEANTKLSKSKGEIYSVKDTHAFGVIQYNIYPTLNMLRSRLNKIEPSSELGNTKEFKKTKDSVIEDIKSMEQDYNDILPDMEQDRKEWVDQEVNKVLKNSQLSEDKKEEVRAQVEGGMRDITFAESMFGLATNMNNILVSMITKKVQEINEKSNSETLEAVNPIIQDIYDRGIQKYQKSVIKKDEDGNTTHFLESFIDFPKFYKEKERIENEILSDLSGKSLEEIEKAIEDGDTVIEILDNDDKKIIKYRQESSERLRGETENIMTDEYDRQKNEKHEKANISDHTKTVIKNMRSRRWAMYSKFEVDGRTDKSTQTEAEKIAERDMLREFKVYRLSHDKHGNPKPYLRTVSVNELSKVEAKELGFSVDGKDKNLISLEGFEGDVIIPVKGVSIESLPEDSRLPVDLFKLDMLYRQESMNEERSKTPAKDFVKKAEQIEEEIGNSFDWVAANSTIGLSNEYYEAIGSGGTNFTNRVQRYIDGLTEKRSEKQDMFNLYKDLQKKRRSLLKQNRDHRNLLNTDVHNMEDITRKEVLAVEEEISKISRGLDLPRDIFQQEFDEVISERRLTEEFESMREESGLSDYDFALLHMTSDKKNRVERFAYSVEDIYNGRKGRVDKSHERFINSIIESGRLKGLDMYEKIQLLKDEYAKANVASYFQRFEPTGYTELISKLKSGQIKMSDMLDPDKKKQIASENPAAQFVEVTPDYAWLADINSEEFNNSNFDKEGPMIQPKLSKYLDIETLNKYGINKEQFLKKPTYDLDKIEATKNKDEFDFLKYMVQMRKLSAENNDSENQVNPYLRVQMSNTKTEKLTKLKTGQAWGSIKDFFKDLTSNRVDDKDYGESVQGLSKDGESVDIKIIPKYFQTKLSDPSEITDNTLQAAVMDVKQSFIRKNRVRYERDIKALEYQISQQAYKKGGGVFGKEKITKKGQASRYAEFARSYVNNHLYGVKQDVDMSMTVAGRKADLTRSLTSFQNFVRFSNLGYNPIVDVTSASTGVITNFTDKLAGDLYHKTSATKARAQLYPMVGNFLAESSKVDKRSPMTMLGEFFNQTSIDERVMDSAQGRGTRFLGTTGFKLSKLANIPITQRNLLLVLNDFKFVNGEFTNFNTFRNRLRLQDPKIKAKQIDAEWNKYKDTLFNNLEVTEQGVKPTSEFNSKFENPKEEMTKLVSRVATMARQINQRADGMISSTDRTMAQRNVFANTLMMHSGWLPILLTKRFKAGHFNTDLNTWEEGHYRTLLSFTREVLSSRKLKDSYSNLEDYQKSNMKRSLREALVWVALLSLGELILAAEDDEDTPIEEFARYAYLRTASEFSTTQIFGIPGEVVSKARSPLTAIRTIEAIEPVGLTMSIFQTVGREGEEENGFLRRIRKNTILKRFEQMGDLKKQTDSYRHFNSATLFNLAD